MSDKKIPGLDPDHLVGRVSFVSSSALSYKLEIMRKHFIKQLVANMNMIKAKEGRRLAAKRII